MPLETFTVYTPVTKMEDQPDGTLMVWGRATAEVVDHANEIMDYKTSEPYFKQRIAENMSRSDGQNMMPIRTMHTNNAAGRTVQMDFKPEEKAIDIAAHIVDPVDVMKVKNHVYTGFSVGGKYARRWADGYNMRYTADPREISLVDAPAVPTAKLTLFKSQHQDIEEKWVADFENAMQKVKEIRAQQNVASELPKNGIFENLQDTFGKFIEAVKNSDYYLNLQKENKMNDDLNKADVGKIVTQLKSAAAAAADIAGKSPDNAAAALNTLLTSINALDVSTPIGSNMAPVSDPSTLIKVETETTTAATSPSGKPTAKVPMDKAEKKSVPAEKETETEETEETEEATTPIEAYKKDLLAINEKVDGVMEALKKMVEVLSEKETPKASDSPVQGLNAMLEKGKGNLAGLTDTEADIIKVLDEGGPYALQKALSVAASGDNDYMNGALAMETLNNAIRKASYADLEARGISANAYRPKFL